MYGVFIAYRNNCAEVIVHNNVWLYTTQYCRYIAGIQRKILMISMLGSAVNCPFIMQWLTGTYHCSTMYYCVAKLHYLRVAWVACAASTAIIHNKLMKSMNSKITCVILNVRSLVLDLDICTYSAVLSHTSQHG